MKLQRTGGATNRGFSLVELISVLAIMGLLSGIAMVSMLGSHRSSKNVIAKNVLERVNEGLKKFSQMDHDITAAEVAALVDGDTTAEEVVFGMLQVVDPELPGSPFVDSRWTPTMSSDADEHRLKWNGTWFEMIEPETAGSGLRVDFLAEDYGG